MESLKKLYSEREGEIKARLRDFELAGYRPEKQVFQELCFCLLTPGSSASSADLAIRELCEGDALYSDGPEKVASVLRGKARFHNVKASNLVRARKLLEGQELIGLLRSRNNRKAREWLVDNVRGLGMKEASHFLRNVGKGQGLAIIDRHVLKNLLEFGFVDKIPKTITPKKYLELEGKVREFSGKMGIPMEELDLLLWSKETGRVFK